MSSKNQKITISVVDSKMHTELLKTEAMQLFSSIVENYLLSSEKSSFSVAWVQHHQPQRSAVVPIATSLLKTFAVVLMCLSGKSHN